MIVIYIAVLYLVCQGNRNSWLLKILALLLGSSIGSVITGYNFYFINYLKVSNMHYVIGLGAGLALHYSMFGVAHFLLAVKYRSMAINVPLLLQGKDQEIPTTKDNVIYWSLITGNIIAPIFYGILGSLFRYKVLTLHEHPDGWFAFWFNAVLDIVAVLQIYTGVILVKSVFDIRSFFVENNAANYINTTMLIRHALAFGAYMITIVMYFTTLCYWGWVQTASAYDWVMITGVIFNAGSVFSQVLLCNIIADLGKKAEAPTE